MIFTDQVTIYNKIEAEDSESWKRTVVDGIQWSDKNVKTDSSGRISVARYAELTFPEGTYEGLELNASKEEDAIFYGVIEGTPTDARGNRISDFMNAHPKSGRIKTVNDNSNRRLLKNIKVIIG